MSRLMDKKNKDGKFPFEYVPAHATDVRATIERAKRRQADAPKQVVKLQRRRT